MFFRKWVIERKVDSLGNTTVEPGSQYPSFEDGNGRIHRYIIHHLLSKMKYTPRGMIFPVSAAILEKIVDYRNILQSYSHPVLDFIQWKITKDNNVEVLNETIDYYRYFDATVQSEFLFDCVNNPLNLNLFY